MSSISDSLQPYVDRHELAGAVLGVANANKILALETVGYSDIEAQQPMGEDALFWIASQTKPVTGTAIMMGVEDGLFQLDDPVEKYIPEFADQMVIVEESEGRKVLEKPSHAFTLREALTHTSGLPWSSPLEQPLVPFLTLRQAVLSYTSLPLQTQPGTAYKYTNTGINSAARVLEITSGQPFEDFLQERLFTPLGMMDTTFWPSREQLTRLAKSYKPNEAGTGLEELSVYMLEYPLEDKRRIPSPGGGLFSTASDMMKFCQMVLRGGEYGGHRFLSEASVAEMTRAQIPPEMASYGLGWSSQTEHIGHSGAYATNMLIFPEEKLITMYLVQHAGFPGSGGEALATFYQTARERFRGQ